MWLSKPVYELLPYLYVAAGLGALAGSIYLNFWYWPQICLALGLALLILGMLLLLKRRDFRQNRRPLD